MSASARIVLAGLMASCSLALAAPPARAASELQFPGFSGACGTTLTCIGDAAESGTVLRVTSATPNQAGAAYATTPILLGPHATFSTTFRFRFSAAGGLEPADGLTFVVTADPTALGGYGGSMGYEGVARSVAVEFDTFNNGEDAGSNHVAIDRNGVLENLAAFNPYGVSDCTFESGIANPGCMADGNIWTATVAYDGEDRELSVTLRDGHKPWQYGITDYDIDLPAILGTNLAYIGFGAGTGDGFQNHDVLDWSFSNGLNYANNLPTPVPEPASVAMLAIALAGLAGARRRR